MNSLTYRLFREIKTGYHLHCCKDVATSFSYIFEKKNSLRIDTGAFSCPADKQNCKCGLRGGRVQWDPWAHGSLRQGGPSLNTQKAWSPIVTMIETGCRSYIPLRHPRVATFKVCVVMSIRQPLPSEPHACGHSILREEGDAQIRGGGQTRP